MCLKDAQVPFLFSTNQKHFFFKGDGEDNLCLWFVGDHSVGPFRSSMLFVFVLCPTKGSTNVCDV